MTAAARRPDRKSSAVRGSASPPPAGEVRARRRRRRCEEPSRPRGCRAPREQTWGTRTAQVVTRPGPGPGPACLVGRSLLADPVVHTVRSSVDATLYGTTTHVRSSCHPRSLPSEELVHLLSRVDPRSFPRPPAAPAVTAASAARADADARPTSYRVGAV